MATELGSILKYGFHLVMLKLLPVPPIFLSLPVLLFTIQTVKLNVGETLELSIQFDPSYKNDLYIRVAEEFLAIKYLEHPQVDYVVLRGEVNFPNLHFETTEVDFGCILNDTEMVHHVTMTNCSPLLVTYHWSFLQGDSIYQER